MNARLGLRCVADHGRRVTFGTALRPGPTACRSPSWPPRSSAVGVVSRSSEEALRVGLVLVGFLVVTGTVGFRDRAWRVLGCRPALTLDHLPGRAGPFHHRGVTTTPRLDALSLRPHPGGVCAWANTGWPGRWHPISHWPC